MKNRIKEFRDQKGLSQAQLGEMVGLTQGLISQIEAGKQETITNVQMVEFAKALEVHPAELIDDPHWSAPYAAGVSAPHLRAVFRVLTKLLRKHDTLPEEVAADVLTSLYRQYIRHSVSTIPAKKIEAEAEVLIKHGMTDRN